MRFMRRLIGVLFFTASLLAATGASAGKRIALVIGNSRYLHAANLPNPARDAAAVGQMFRDARFDIVDVKTDLNGAAFKAALRDFTTATSDVDIAVVYFAGHGVEVGGTNYLVPIDARLARDIDVEDEAVSLERVQRSMEKARQLRLVILDACRENPFASHMQRTSSTRSIGRGLARMEEDEGNSLVAFAAKAGSTAADGDAEHSPYTAALLANLTIPGLDIRFALGKVRDAVVKATRGNGATQVPAVYGSYGGDALPLVPGPAGTTAAASDPGPSAPTQTPSVRPPRTQSEAGDANATSAARADSSIKPPSSATTRQQLADLPPPPPPRQRYWFPVNTEPDGWAALKAAPNLRAPRLARVYDGTRFVVDGYQNGWAHVRLLTGESGWIVKRLVGCCAQ